MNAESRASTTSTRESKRSNNSMEELKRIVDRWLGRALILLMGLAVLNVLWQVLSRFVLGDPSSFTQELARFLLIWVGILGAGYGVGQGDHLALELIPEQFTGRSRDWLQIMIQSFILAFGVGVLIVGGIRLVYVQLSLGQTSASLDIPVGYVYVVLPLTGTVIVFYTLTHIRRHLRALAESDDTISLDPPDQPADE